MLSSCIVKVKFIDFKVYFPKKCEPFFVHVRQPETATVEVVCSQAISQYNEQSSQFKVKKIDKNTVNFNKNY